MKYLIALIILFVVQASAISIIHPFHPINIIRRQQQHRYYNRPRPTPTPTPSPKPNSCNDNECPWPKEDRYHEIPDHPER